MSVILAIAFLVLLALSFPVSHALVVGATLGVLSSDNLSLFGIIQQLYLPTQSFPLIAIPFFIMAAELMMTGKLGTASHRFRNGPGRPVSGRACPGQRAWIHPVRRGFGLGGRRCDGTRRGARSLADQDGLPEGILRRHHCRRVDDRHPDSAVDPPHPLFPGIERLYRRIVFRRHPARLAGVARLSGGVQRQRAAPRIPLHEGACRVGTHGQTRALRHARPDDAGAGASFPAIRRHHPNRGQHQCRRLRDARVRPLLSRSHLGARQEIHLCGGCRDRRGPAAHHGVDGSGLDTDAGTDSRAVPELGEGKFQHEILGASPDERDDAGSRDRSWTFPPRFSC